MHPSSRCLFLLVLLMAVWLVPGCGQLQAGMNRTPRVKPIPSPPYQPWILWSMRYQRPFSAGRPALRKNG